MATKRITIFGGSGFLGRYVVAKLAHAKHLLRIPTRSPEKAMALKPYGDLGQISPVVIHPHNHAHLTEVIAGSDWVINLVGILAPHHTASFHQVHVEFPKHLAEIAAQASVPHFLHVSALGVQHASTSLYARSKLSGEQAVLNEKENAIIVRPSVLFGPEDDFLNRFATMARLLPFVPIIGPGANLLQPVYVGDVAAAICRLVEGPISCGTPFELGGPATYSLHELASKVLEWAHRKRPLLSLPYGIAKCLGMLFKMLPNPPFIPDHVELVKQDNVVDPTAPGFQALDISPVALESIAPSYLMRYHPKRI